MSQSILCPNCKCQIEVSDALSATVREQLRLEFEATARRKDGELKAREATLHERERSLDDARRAIDAEISGRVAQEKERVLTEAKSQAQDAFALDLKDLKSQLADAKQQLGQAQQAELQLRQDRRKLEDEKQMLELTVIRQLDEERTRIRESAKRDADEEHRLQSADKDKMVDDLRRQINDLKRKSEQGVPQSQGEVMEIELEETLRRQFPMDVIEPVPVSKHGGDVLHYVCDTTGEVCGIILWESKRTRSWNDAWLPKLRDDQRLSKAQVAVLTSIEMPRTIAHFGLVDGVWVTNRACMLGLAGALRAGLLEVGRTRRSVVGKQTKVEQLYSYLSSTDFSNRIQGIVEAFVSMRDDLESEKRSMSRIWSKREKQLDRAVNNTSCLYGELGGILGASLPQIEQLELAGITAESFVDESEKAPWE